MRRLRKLSPERRRRDARIRRLWAIGWPTGQIASEVGVSPDVVYELVGPSRSRRRYITWRHKKLVALRKRIRRLWASGRSAKEIAPTVGMSHKFVYGLVDASQRRRQRTTARQKEVIALWKRGLPVRDVAAKLGISEHACYGIAGQLRHGKHRKDIELGERDRRIRRLRFYGRPVDEIAKIVSVPKAVVLRVARRVKPRKRRVSPIERKCLALWKKGASGPRIDTRLGLVPNATYILVAKHRMHRGPNREREARNRRIKALWEKGVSSPSIARLFGLTTQAVCLIAQQRGFVRLQPLQRLRRKNLRHQEILRLCEQGKTTAEIAEATGYALHGVQTTLHQHGKRAAMPGAKQRAARNRSILRMWDRGVLVREIAEKHRLNPLYVARIAHKHGRPPRPPFGR